MKAIVIHGSPNKDKGDTSFIANPFIEKLQELGVDIKTFYIYDLKINNCLGCYNCLMKKKGECIQEDDMRFLFSELYQADIKIFVFPVHSLFLPASIKTVIDRSFPIFEPYLEINNDLTMHPVRSGFKRGKIVLISSCGYWEESNFDQIIDYFDKTIKYVGYEWGGGLFRPHALALKCGNSRDKIGDVVQGSEDAARELVERGRISPKTEQKVSQELMSRQDYVEWSNILIKKTINDFYGKS